MKKDKKQKAIKKYFKVEGEIIDYCEYYVEARNYKDALKRAEKIEGLRFDSVEVRRVSKKEYNENKREY